jgi:hypothetical protein
MAITPSPSDEREAEEQDRQRRQQIVERQRQGEQDDQEHPCQQQCLSGQAADPPIVARMHGILDPLDVTPGTDQDVLQLAAAKSATADEVGQ